MAVEQNISSKAPLAANPPGRSKPRGPGGRKALILLLLVCVTPVVASYLAYYFMPPEGRINYGTLIDPQQDVSSLWIMPLADTLPAGEQGRLTLDTPAAPQVSAPADGFVGTPGSAEGVSLADWRGRWLMIVVAPGACAAPCPTNLYDTRQVRLTTGKNRDRVQRLWFVIDDAAPDPKVLADHSGIVAARVDPAALAKLFKPAAGQAMDDHIFLVDPLGNLMMRFPAEPDPSRMKKDLIRLLKASRIG